VHTHSPAATALACHGLGLPAFHYMVAAAGGTDIRCAAYATFGTQALSDHALAALAGRKACLLAHHGVIACERDLAHALALAIEVEHLARVYLQARVLGEPPQLDAAEMAQVIERFRTYGKVTPT
jgi:L-fuculose-phosphate aldolase